MSTYFITGATGLIGSALVEHLSSQSHDVIVYVRNASKARDMLGEDSAAAIVEGTLEGGITYNGDVDYILHGAAPTDSSFFMSNPVETIDSIVLGTKSVLEFAKEKKVKSVVNLSSMEVYGTPTNEEDLTEDQQFYLDPLNIRSDYPQSKRLAENMCAAYAVEYNVPVKSARLAQVLAKELPPEDNRVIAQFIRAAKDGRDIELATDGMTKQTYVGIDDAVDAIMTILEKGENGQSYNIANDGTYCSIYELATIVAENIATRPISVKRNENLDTSKYPPNRTLRINSRKLQALGWQPRLDLLAALKQLADIT